MNIRLIKIDKYILVAVVLLCCNIQNSIFAVKKTAYTPFIDDGKVWLYSSCDCNTDLYHIFGLKIDGDSIIEGVKWNKCMWIDLEGAPYLSKPIALLREKDRKVYMHLEYDSDYEKAKRAYIQTNPRGYMEDLLAKYIDFNSFINKDYLYSKKELLLYDFSDTEQLSQYWPSSLSHMFCDTPYANIWYQDEMGIMHNCYHINRKEELTPEEQKESERITEPGYGYIYYPVYDEFEFPEGEIITKPENFLIEGIGATRGEFAATIISPYVFAYCMMTSLNNLMKLPNLIAIYDKSGRVIFKDEYFDLFVHVKSDSSAKKSDELHCYDLLGNEIDESKLTKGTIYIKNNKKIMK